ncbi:MAG: TonB-dependent siderophore receptor [Cyanobacteria bacterium P01_G01_bin.67]
MRFISPFTGISTSILITTLTVHFTAPVLAQQLTQIIGVDVRETEQGIEIIVETVNASVPEFVQTPDNNILYIDLVDSQLNLASGESFQVETPAETIESVTVSEEFAGSVAIIIKGTESLPQVELIPNDQGGIFSITTTPAVAETSPATPEPEQEIEIIVTGDPEPEEEYIRRETSIGRGNPTSILETLQSVQTVTEELIEDQNINNLSDIQRNVSGVNLGGNVPSQFPGSSFVIRGFSAVAGRENILRNGLRDDTVRFISGVPNIERVEVLKGPASVLFGQGVIGGTINLVTKKPQQEPSYNLEFTAGNFETYRGSLDFTGSLNEDESLAYRINFAYESEGSFQDFQETDFLFADVGVSLIDSEKTKLYIGLEYQDSSSSGAASQLPASGTVIDNPLGSVDFSENLGEPSLAESDLTVVRLNSEFEYQISDNWKVQSQLLGSFLEQDGIGFANINLVSDRFLTRLLIDNPGQNNIITLNSNVVGEVDFWGMKHQLLMGVEVATQQLEDKIDFQNVASIDIFEPVFSPDSVGNFVLSFEDSVTIFSEVGLYIQDQITITEGLILSLGGRYNIAKSEFDDAINPEANSDRTDLDFTPRAGLIYQPVENVSLYASYTESFLPNSGASTELDPATGTTVVGEEFEPEVGRQIEIGVKAELFDERVLATLALFDLKRSNVLDFQTLSTSQVGEQKSQGIELDLAGEILPGWKIISNYTLLDTEILEDDTFTVGNQLQNAPENAFSIWSTYNIQKGSLAGLGFGLGFFFEGEKQGDLNNSFTVPSFFRTDAALFYQKKSFQAQLNIQNLFDVEYIESAEDEFQVNPAPPFTVLGTLSLEF